MFSMKAIHLEKLTVKFILLFLLNIDNAKKSTKSAYEWFLKDHVTLKTGVMLKIQLCITGKNYI